jgi:hypothetical protein
MGAVSPPNVESLMYFSNQNRQLYCANRTRVEGKVMPSDLSILGRNPERAGKTESFIFLR